MRETDIMHENGAYWVARDKTLTGEPCYAVYRPAPGGTHSTGDSAYPRTPDGLSLAKARCDYLAKREAQRAEVQA
jgi:hypothetical protein